MVPEPPPLPMRFPCWCRAVYSWGGENPHDLGFIEGDLIECVNAGDGSWWTGRLWRDRRTIGSFPSNFVEVLPPDFRPSPRSASPNPTPSPTTVQPQKSRTFRKPYEAYAKAPHYTTAKQPEVFLDQSPVPQQQQQQQQQRRSRENSATSLRDDLAIGSHHQIMVPRGRSPVPRTSPTRHGYDVGGLAAQSPRYPDRREYGSRAPSPNPYAHDYYGHPTQSPVPVPVPAPARGRSPVPYHAASPAPPGAPSPRPYHPASPAPPRAHSPMPYYPASPAPPPPRARSPMPYHPSPAPERAHSPMPYHPAVSPAPFRDPSPAPFHAASPAPSPFRPYRRAAEDPDSPPPPPPPPHRHAGRNNSIASYNDPYTVSRHGSDASYNQQVVQSPAQVSRHSSQVSYEQQPRQPERQDSGYLTPRVPSPCPPSPGGSHLTPSPLREAMDGVIEQLDALGMSRRKTESPEPTAIEPPWSPDSYEATNRRPRKNTAPARSQTALSMMVSDEGYETWSGNSSQPDPYGQPANQAGARPGHGRHLSNYVERMETRMRGMHERSESAGNPHQGLASPAPIDQQNPHDRPKSSLSGAFGLSHSDSKLRHRKSAYEVGRSVLSRTFTTKTTSTNATNTTSTTNSSGRSLMSGASAGAFSATSAGSYARRVDRAQSAVGIREDSDRPETPFTGITYHSSHASGPQPPVTRPKSQTGWHNHADDVEAGVGGLVHPKAPKRNIFKKIFDSAKTGVANGRSNILMGGGGESPTRSSPLARSMQLGSNQLLSPAAMGGGGHGPGRDVAREMGFGSGVDWVQVRRDVNRSNSLSKIEHSERRDRCQMLDYPVINPVDELYERLQGDEGADGMPVQQTVNYSSIQFGQVDKNTRFISSLPPTTTAITLATTYVCRPYRSEVQRLRAIFTYVAEKINWEEDYEGQTRIDTRRVLQTKRACPEEYAVLVKEMCCAVGIQCEVVRGYLKKPGEIPESGIVPRPNHWWNALVLDGQWRMMDCCLASPSNPCRHLYSSVSNGAADFWYFLARPSELCWTHIPEHHANQHIVPPAALDVLLNLPCACPPFFRNEFEMVDFNSSLIRIEDLEMVHLKFNVPEDVEVAAEVEVRTFSRDSDGDIFENGDALKKRALAQAEWFGGVKRYTVKALLPGDEGQGVLKIYAGKRGLMHSIKDIPHPLAFALPIVHTGENPAYEFVTRHPTPHAQRHDIYVVQPQCQRLALNNTYVFAIRQHPSSSAANPLANVAPIDHRAASPIPFIRPSSALSMTAASSSGGSNPSTSSGGYGGSKKPAKLAIQTPGGKILRLMRKEDRSRGGGMGTGPVRGIGPDEEIGDGGTWETIIKCSERGTWRGLVLADRTARWCVFAEWVCM